MEIEIDLTLKTIIEFRAEMREFRAETREFQTETRSTLAEHAHRLNLIGTTVGSHKTDVGALLEIAPTVNERLDRLEARVEVLERRD